MNFKPRARRIKSLGWHLEEIHVTLAHLEKKRARLRLYTKSFEETVHTERGDGVTNFKRRRQDFQIDGVMDLTTASGCSRLKVALEDSTWRRHYSKPSYEGYRNTIELPEGNNVVPLQSNTIRLVQNGCAFHGLQSEDPNQHLKDFLKFVDSLDLDVANRERKRLCIFQFSICNQASNWLECLPAGSILTWEDLTTHESFYDAWTRFKDLLLKVPHHGLDLWLQVQIFYDYVDYTIQMAIDYVAGGILRKLRPEVACETIVGLAQYEKEGRNDPILPEEGSLDYINPNIEQLLGVIKCKVDMLMKNMIPLMGRSEDVYVTIHIRSCKTKSYINSLTIDDPPRGPT
ncbi:hypothetical protein Tco_1030563 [Tanacetum coccineum]|uniref:MAK10-like protein n=1 Tax=Tanacetum coccineum TaxID=301880 RepID=A0ABQ5G8F5_9ASTR